MASTATSGRKLVVKQIGAKFCICDDTGKPIGKGACSPNRAMATKQLQMMQKQSVKASASELEIAPELIQAATLTTKKRKSLPSTSFVFPNQRRYPIHDRAHAANALARAAGKPEYAKVRAAVCARYPDLPSCKKGKSK